MPELWPPRLGGPLYEWLRSRFPNASASAARRAAMDIDAYVRDLLRNQRTVHVRQARISAADIRRRKETAATWRRVVAEANEERFGYRQPECENGAGEVEPQSLAFSVQLRPQSLSVALKRIRDAIAAGRPYGFLKAWQEAPADALDLIHRARGSRDWSDDELNEDRIPRPELIEPHIEEALKLAAKMRRPPAWRRDVAVGVIIDHFGKLGGEPGQKHRLAFVLGIEAFYSEHAPGFSVDFGVKRSGRNKSRLLG